MRTAESDKSRLRAARHVRNQQNARRLNEQIAGRRYSAAFDEYICECGKKKCVEPVSLSTEEFNEIRKHAGLFVVRPGHASRKYVRILRDGAKYQLVESLVAASDGSSSPAATSGERIPAAHVVRPLRTATSAPARAESRS